MKLAAVVLFAFSIFGYNKLYAQRCDTITYQSMYWTDGFSGLFPQKIFVSADNIFTTGISAPLNTERPEAGEVMLTKLTARGTPLWCKNIGNSGLPFQNDDFAQDAIKTNDGGFVYAGNTQADNNSHYDGWLAKIDANGKVVWTEIFDSQASRLFKVIQLSDGSFAAIGVSYTNFEYDGYGNTTKVYNNEAYIVHVDKDGKLLWSRSFFSKQINALFSITQLQDGNLVILGETKDNGITDPWFRYMAKVDFTTGKFIWTNGYQYPETGYWQPDVKEMPDGRICIHNGSNVSYFDENGNALKNIFFTVADNSWDGQFVRYIGTGLPGEDYYYAFKFRYVYLFKIKNDSAVIWAHTYSVKSLPGSITEMRDVVMANNSFYMNVEIQTQDFPNAGSNYYPYLLKTDAEGNTPCADTFSTAFKFSSPDVMGNFAISFTDNGSPLKPFFRGLHSNDNSPHQAKDCYQFSCCTDTLMYKNASLCEGSSYTLPDGNTVSAAGVYPTAFKTFKGCDSVIFTTVNLQQKVKISLGNDTCFANSNPITYKLSFPQQVQYQWQDGSADSMYAITKPGQYWVKVSTACNSSADTVVVFSNCDFPVYIPSAFTPNNDGRNDVFRVLNFHNQHLLNISIYNRFGQKIFITADPAKGWDGIANGTMQQTGTYIYIVKYNDIAGHYHEQKGTVVLIR